MPYGATLKDRKTRSGGYTAPEEGGGKLVHRTTLFRSDGKDGTPPADRIEKVP
jgi:hypothetical protein